MEEESMRQQIPKIRQKAEQVVRRAPHHGLVPMITFEEARREARRKADELLGEMTRELDSTEKNQIQKAKNA